MISKSIFLRISILLILFYALVSSEPPPGILAVLLKQLDPPTAFLIHSIFRIIALFLTITVIWKSKSSYRQDISGCYAFFFRQNGKPDSERTKSVFAFLQKGLIPVFLLISLLVILDQTILKFAATNNSFFMTLANRVSPIISLCLSWVFFAGLFAGLGASLHKLIDSESQSENTLFDFFWIGIVFAIVILQIWHLFMPINKWALLSLTVISCIGAITNRRFIIEIVRKSRIPGQLIFPLLLILFFWLANAVLFPPYSNDSGLYDFSAIQWLKKYAIVPGLANLLGPLGYNNTSYLVTSVIDQSVWFEKAHHIINNLLIGITIVQGLISAFKFSTDSVEKKSFHIYNIFMILPCLWWAQGRYISSPSPDLLLYPLGIFLFSRVLLYASQKSIPKNKSFGFLFTIVTVAMAGVTIKLSFFAFAACSILLSLFIWALHFKGSWAGVSRQMALLFLGGFLLIGTWSARSVILSGYVGYPKTILACDVSWRAPAEPSEKHIRAMMAMARNPEKYDSKKPESVEPILADYHWLGPWIRDMAKFPMETMVPMGLALACLFLILLRPGAIQNHKMLLLIFIPITSILFWFFTIPLLSMEGPAFWVLAGYAFAMALTIVPKKSSQITLSIAVLFILFSCAFFYSFIRPGLNMGFVKPPIPEYKTLHSVDGVKINTPMNDESCWSIPIPCAGRFNRNLRYRKPGDIQSGFILIQHQTNN